MSGNVSTDPTQALTQELSDMQATYSQTIGLESQITNEKALFDVALDAAKQRPQV